MDPRPSSPAKAPARAAALAVFLGLAAFAMVLWVVLKAQPGSEGPAWIAGLPCFDACSNAASAALALAGFWAVRRGRTSLHRACMLAALACSACFLGGYLVYHHYRGETRFLGTGPVRVLYLSLLASHVVLSFFVLPLLLVTVAFAGLGVFQRHRSVARWTLPLWLYVSVTGVLVYLFLRTSYPK